MIVVLALLVGFLTGVVWYWWRDSTYWEEQGLPYLSARFPFSSITPLLGVKTTAGELLRDVYRLFPDSPACGFYKFGTPCLLLRDPDLIKHVLVKEFSSFTDNDFFVTYSLDPLMALNPFAVHDVSKWKELRSIQVRAQSLAKVRSMYPDIMNTAKSLAQYVKKCTGRAIEGKELATKYTGDSVGACVFGLESNSFQNSEDFGNAAKGEVFGSSYFDNLAVLSAMLFPTLATVLRLRVIRKDLNDYFLDVVKKSAEYRQKSSLRREDFLQQLLDTKSPDGNPGYNDNEMAAHCMTFYMDGYETTGLALAWALWELGRNPDAQQKLIKEIRSVGDKLEDFQDVDKLPYLDAVMSETLRLHPPIQTLGRICNREMALDCNGKQVRIKKGMPVMIPLLGLHTDPQYFPEPDCFLPSRFLQPPDFPKFAYLPYGEGPRICPGMKFAMMQVKTGIISVLLEHRIEVVNNEVSLDPFCTFLHSPKGGLWLRFLPQDIP